MSAASAGRGLARGQNRRAGLARVRRRRRPPQSRRRGAHSRPRLDRHRRAADERGVRERDRAPAPAHRGDFDRAARHDRRRLLLRALVHHADPHADSAARRAWPPGQLETRVDIRTGDEFGAPRRRVQHDGRSPGRAAGERQAAGAAGDVRPHRRRPRARSLAPDSEHRQQHAPDRPRRCRRRRSRETFRQHDRARARRRSSGSWTTCATSSSRSRSSGFRMDVDRSVAEIVEAMRPEGERHGIAVEAHYAAGTAHHRRRPVRARPRVPQPDHQRDSGHRRRAAR